MHGGAKDQRCTEQRHNYAAIRHRLPGDVELRLEFIRHEPVPTSLQNSDNTGYLSLCDHHIPAGRGIKIESGRPGLRKCDPLDPPTSNTPRVPIVCRFHDAKGLNHQGHEVPRRLLVSRISFRVPSWPWWLTVSQTDPLPLACPSSPRLLALKFCTTSRRLLWRPIP